MNIPAFLLIPAVFLMLISTASAADVLEKFPLRHALENEKVIDAISSNFPLYWGDQNHPTVKKEFGKYRISKRTTAVGKSARHACEWALASAIIELQNRASSEGGNALIDIKSNIKNELRSSATDFDCLRRGKMVNVALEGTVVTLGK
jgi:hypothetical protein